MRIFCGADTGKFGDTGHAMSKFHSMHASFVDQVSVEFASFSALYFSCPDSNVHYSHIASLLSHLQYSFHTLRAIGDTTEQT